MNLVRRTAEPLFYKAFSSFFPVSVSVPRGSLAKPKRSYLFGQCFEPRIAAQGVQHRLDVDERHKTRAFLVSLLEPLERPIQIAQSHIDYRDKIRRDVLSLRDALQLRDHLPGFAALTQLSVGVSEVGDEGR